MFAGMGESVSYASDEEDRVVIDRDTIEQLGSVEAIRAHFAAAEFLVPPLVVEGGPS